MIERLIDLARRLGYHKMVLAARCPTTTRAWRSTRAGFTRVGIYLEQDQLDGRWVDTLIMEKLL